MTQEEILEYKKRCAEVLGIKVDYNVADWSKYNDKSLTEHWNNDNKTWVHTPKGQGLPWYKVKHKNKYYQLFTDFTFAKLKESDLELGGYYKEKYYLLKDMEFHSDWNWIMEVVDAIAKIPNKHKDGLYKYLVHLTLNPRTGVTIEGMYSRNFNDKDDYQKITSFEKDFKTTVVQAINQFLIWYNTQKL